MPWPVADRDAVLIGTRSSFGQSVQITLESKPDMVSPVDGKVRIEKISGNWTLTPEGEDKVKVSYEMNIDPGGDIPKWIVNSMTVDLPFHTLSKLRALVE